MDYADRITRKRLAEIRDGSYSFEDAMEGDGLEKSNIRIKVVIGIRGDEAIIDFRESDDQTRGSVNAVYAITLSCVLYVFRCLIKEDIPTNAGILRPITLLTREKSIVDAGFPAAVAGGNVETSQRIVDVLLGALSQALPETIPAASQGTMNNLALGGTDSRTGRTFAYYETLAGGTGATVAGDGERGVHSHMTNTLNTPVEALEFAYPFLVREYSFRRDSGGKGACYGGDGIRREIQILDDCEVTILSERREIPPYGLAGGEPGKVGENLIIRKGKKIKKPGKFYEKMEKGDILRIETPGGGGYGRKSY
jgi:N-methylhydantoinase B